METMLITSEPISVIRNQFRINWDGIPGISHWARVYGIGMRLAEQTGANKKVVKLSSVSHDSRRHNENLDPKHGIRGAELANLNDKDMIQNFSGKLIVNPIFLGCKKKLNYYQL